MKPLLEIADRHPLATTLVGVTSGTTSWILDHSAQITGIAGMIGACCTAGIASLALAAKLAALGTAAFRWLQRQRRNRAQRRFHKRIDPRRLDPADELP